MVDDASDGIQCQELKRIRCWIKGLIHDAQFGVVGKVNVVADGKRG